MCHSTGASPPTRRAFCFVKLFAFVLLVSRALAAQQPAEALFAERCSACHTVGGGDEAGPDLLPATKLPTEELRAAVERMEENSGEMTDAEVDSLVALLQSPDVARQLSPEPSVEAPPPAAPTPAGSAANGRKLFYGERPFANGGSPCFACHAVAGRGGNLAVDLTSVGARMSHQRLHVATAKAPFPAMKATYMNRPLAPQEGLDVVAFLQQKHSPGGAADSDSAGLLHAGATGAALVVIGGFALAVGRRRGFRSRFARHSRR